MAGIVLGALSFLIPFIIFFKTMAPTLSFWDCGEFIAAANTLGVPHPPGTPFFVVLGRFAIILGLFKNIAMRTNFISVLASSMTTLVAYFLVVRASQRLPFENMGSSRLGQVGIRIGAFSSSLLMAFSSTFWFNAVETEVYGMAMFLMMLIIWLAVKWADEKEEGGSDKLLVFLTYILFLSISIHLTVFLIVPALFVFFVLVDREKLKDPIFWGTWAILFSVAIPFYFMIGMMIPAVEDKSYWIWVSLMILGAVFSGVMAFGKNKAAGKRTANWTLAFALFAAGIVGYSTHIYIPIRASQNPAINENDPSNFERFESYIERKQYGQESMVSRMFYRRGALSHQFGRYENMGFGGYFWDQYASRERWDLWGVLPYVIFALGVFGIVIGIYWAVKRFKIHPMLLLFMIFFISSVLLILYLNFSDGTRPDPTNPSEVIQLEVRERDYFYTPAFVIFASIIGMGMAGLLYLIGSGLNSKRFGGNESLRYALFAVISIGILLMPLNPATANYKNHDRSKDFAPADYGTNILKSCLPRAIIFTNGDNDTFPLWYLQEVEHVRNDVRVVNLSLLNTDWYILQLKHQMGIKINLEDDQISWIPADRRGSIIYYRPAKPFYDQVRRTQRYLTAEQDRKTGQVIRVQDQMIEQIVLTNLDNTPIYFSGSVPTSNRWTLSNYLIHQGIVLKVDPDTTKPRVDIPVFDSLVTKVYNYRGLNDLNAFRDENNVGLTTTFPERFSELAEAFRVQNRDTASSLSTLWKGVKFLPYYHQLYMDLVDIYNQQGNKPMVDSVASFGTSRLKDACNAWPDIVLYQQFLGVLDYRLSEVYTSDPSRREKYINDALTRYRLAYRLKPDDQIAYRLLRDLNLRMSQEYASDTKKRDIFYRDAMTLMTDWSQRHPEDIDTRNYLNRIR